MKDIEKALLNNASLDELIKMKIEQEFTKRPKKKTTGKKVVTDLKDVPPEKIFTKASVFHVYNRHYGTETFIDGVQADAMIGIQSGIREKFLNKTLTTFSTDDAYVKFEKATI